MEKNGTILIVDDSALNRALLKEIFSSDYFIAEASNGVEALEYIRRNAADISVILLDVVMPELDGFGVIAEMSKEGLLEFAPVVIITSENSANNEERLLELGASDIISKPFKAGILTKRVRNVVNSARHTSKLEELASDLTRRLRLSYSGMVDTLSSIIEYRSLESGEHILRTRKFTQIMLEELAKINGSYNLSEKVIEMISSASVLHDIGKIVIPDAILNKPGKLTDEEFAVMKTHALEGSKIVNQFARTHKDEYLRFAYDIARHHHERWDGRGYPDGLCAEQIPLCAQVTGVVDVYDALTTKRVYKDAFSHEKALAMIEGGECGAFSEEMLHCLRNAAPRLKALAEDYSGKKLRAGREPCCDLSFGFGDDNIDYYKYLTALRIMDAIVAEIDFDSDSFSFIYPSWDIFKKIPKNISYREGFTLFADNYVHPDYREKIKKHVKAHCAAVMRGKNIEESGTYPIFSEETNSYVSYHVTYARVDAQDSQRHKVLLVFKEQADQGAIPLTAASSEKEKNSSDKAEEKLYRAKSASEPTDIFFEWGIVPSQFIKLFDSPDEIFFVADLSSGALKYSGPLPEFPCCYSNASIRDLMQDSLESIHADDRYEYMKHLMMMESGLDCETLEFRVKDVNGNYVKLRKRIRQVREREDSKQYAIGIITMIG